MKVIYKEGDYVTITHMMSCEVMGYTVIISPGDKLVVDEETYDTDSTIDVIYYIDELECDLRLTLDIIEVEEYY